MKKSTKKNLLISILFIIIIVSVIFIFKFKKSSQNSNIDNNLISTSCFKTLQDLQFYNYNYKYYYTFPAEIQNDNVHGNTIYAKLILNDGCYNKDIYILVLMKNNYLDNALFNFIIDGGKSVKYIDNPLITTDVFLNYKLDVDNVNKNEFNSYIIYNMSGIYVDKDMQSKIMIKFKYYSNDFKILLLNGITEEEIKENYYSKKTLFNINS